MAVIVVDYTNTKKSKFVPLFLPETNYFIFVVLLKGGYVLRLRVCLEIELYQDLFVHRKNLLQNIFDVGKLKNFRPFFIILE